MEGASSGRVFCDNTCLVAGSMDNWETQNHDMSPLSPRKLFGKGDDVEAGIFPSNVFALTGGRCS